MDAQRKVERRIVTVCGWCPDAPEQTAAARAHGFDVSHGICPACEKRWQEQSEQRRNEEGEQS
jgi:hypothetical protein